MEERTEGWKADYFVLSPFFKKAGDKNKLSIQMEATANNKTNSSSRIIVLIRKAVAAIGVGCLNYL